MINGLLDYIEYKIEKWLRRKRTRKIISAFKGALNRKSRKSIFFIPYTPKIRGGLEISGKYHDEKTEKGKSKEKRTWNEL